MFPDNPIGRESRITNWRDLEKYGIECLTGESCGLGLRLLCDVSPEGIALLEEFLSIKLTDENNSWNHQGHEGWKSILLPRGIFEDLAVFCLVKEEGFKHVVVVNWDTKHATAFYIEGYHSDALLEEFRAAANKIYDGQWKSFYNMGTAGTRNRHYFSGRVT